MKRIGSAIISTAVLLWWHCVQGPVVVDNNHVAPEKALPVTLGSFDGSIVKTSQCAIVEFYSEKCPICTSLIWVIDSLYASFGDSMLIGANNTDADTLWKRFDVTTVPTYLMFAEGKEIARRSFVKNDPGVYDTLAIIARKLLAGTLAADTADTGTRFDTIPDNYLTLDESSFDSTVLRKGTTALVFFLYAGGAPCIHMDSVVTHLAPRFKNRAVIAKVHAWDQQALSDRYGIYFVPQFLFFRDGVLRPEIQQNGVVPGDTLVALLERLLADTVADKVILLDKSNFDDSINVAGRITMVDFFSPTCPACITMNGVVSALADTFSGTAVVAKINVLENDSLVNAFNIKGWPTFVFFDSGNEYARILGKTDIDSLAARIRNGIAGGD